MPTSEQAAGEIVERIDAAIGARPGATVACHGDLTLASLFLDGNHTWIVDYRWAGAGDPFDDLGSIAAHLSLSDDRCDAMLALYFGGVDSARRSHLALMRLAAEYLAGIRELVGASSTSAIGAAERRCASLVETASDPRVDAWLGIASPSP